MPVPCPSQSKICQIRSDKKRPDKHLLLWSFARRVTWLPLKLFLVSFSGFLHAYENVAWSSLSHGNLEKKSTQFKACHTQARPKNGKHICRCGRGQMLAMESGIAFNLLFWHFFSFLFNTSVSKWKWHKFRITHKTRRQMVMH